MSRILPCLEKSINFAKIIRDMEDEVISIIKRARKFVLFPDFNTWLKKEGNPLFDVAIEKLQCSRGL